MNKTLFNAMFGIAVLIFVGAWIYSGKIKPGYTTAAEAEPQAILDRIRPVSETPSQKASGSVSASDDPSPRQPAVTVTATADPSSDRPAVVVTDTITAANTDAALPPAADAASKLGKETYAAACFVCHMSGVAGSPKLGDAEAWAPRIAQGIDVLNANAIKGFQGSAGMMPPKGGRTDLSDEAVIAAVAYMVAESGGM